MREDTGERVVALVGDGGYAEYAIAPARARLPDPRRARRRHGAGADHPGPDRLAPVPHGRARRRRRERRRALGRRRRRLARRAARPAARRRARDRDRLERRRSARSRSSWAPTSAIDADARGADRAAAARPTSGRPVDVVFEMAGGAVFDASYAALAPFGRIVVYGIASQRAERGAHRLAAAPLARGRRLLAVPLPRAPGRCSPRRSPTCSRAPRAASCARWSARPTRSSRRAQAQIDLRERRTTGKLLLDPPRERSSAPRAPRRRPLA